MIRYTAIFLAFLMVIGCLSSCADDGSKGKENTEETTERQLEEIKSELFDFVSCRFTDEVRAKDTEMATTYYPSKEDKVYVDTVLNFGSIDTELTAEDFSGSVMYNNASYKLLYCKESDSSVSVSADSITKDGGVVHLFTVLPEEAKDERIVVTFNVADEEYECEAETSDAEEDPMADKLLLKVGDKLSTYGGAVEFEVLGCTAVQSLSASDKENTKHYGVDGSLYGDIVLKITNNMTDKPITSLMGYFKMGEASFTLNTMMEISENTELSEVWEISPGATEILHVIAQFEKDVNVSEIPLRFNFGGNCYYSYVEKLEEETEASEATDEASPDKKPEPDTAETKAPEETKAPVETKAPTETKAPEESKKA